MTLFQSIYIAKKFKLTYQRPQKSPCGIPINDDGGRACDAADGQTSAPQPCGFCLPHDAHREHNLQVLRLLPQQLELPCDVDVHAQDPLSLHVAHTVPETKVTHTFRLRGNKMTIHVQRFETLDQNQNQNQNQKLQKERRIEKLTAAKAAVPRAPISALCSFCLCLCSCACIC